MGVWWQGSCTAAQQLHRHVDQVPPVEGYRLVGRATGPLPCCSLHGNYFARSCPAAVQAVRGKLWCDGGRGRQPREHVRSVIVLWRVQEGCRELGPVPGIRLGWLWVRKLGQCAFATHTRN